MQKDAFRGVLIVAWMVSLAALWVSLFLSPFFGVAGIFTWLGITPLSLGLYWLVNRRFRLATWLWVGVFIVLLILIIPWNASPNLGAAPYGFILVVVASSMLISRAATLIVAGLASGLSVIALALTGYLTLAGLGALFPPLAMAWVTAVMGWVSSDYLVTALMWTRASQVEANTQAEYLRQSRDALEKSLLIRDNLHAQLQEVHQQVTRRAMQLETAGEVSRRITALLDLKQLLIEVTNLICDKFGYYYVGVFLVDEKERVLVLRAAGGERGPAVLERGLRVEIEESSLNGRAVKLGQVQWINDVSMSPYFRLDPLLHETVSELVIPLLVGQRVVGTLDVQSAQCNAFTPDDVAALRGLAAQVAIAIQNTRLYESEQVRRQVAETLREVGRILGSTLDLAEVLSHLLEQLARVVPYGRSSVMLQSGNVLRMAAVRGYDNAQKAMGIRVDIRENDVFSQVSQSRQVLVIPDVTEFPGWKQQPSLPMDHSWLGAPLIAHDKVIGMLSLTRQERAAFGRDEGEVAYTFANQAAIAIQNASLYEQIRGFNQQLEQMVQERTAELEGAYRLLEQLDQTKSNFINIAAHELRTPLTVMKGYTDMMRLDPAVAGSPFLTEILTGVVTGTARLYEIVNSMLDIARIDSNVLDLHSERVEVPAVVRRVQSEFASALAERHLTLQLDGLDSLPVIQADPDMLYKALYSVVINAIKFTPDGGAIAIVGKHIHGGGMNCAELLVRDTGIGIDPEHHELIFQKFYQTGQVALHSSGKTKFKGGGPGLGLAIARGIVEAHNGRIWVESEGHDEQACPGSAFHILLPVEAVPVRPKILP